MKSRLEMGWIDGTNGTTMTVEESRSEIVVFGWTCNEKLCEKIEGSSILTSRICFAALCVPG